MKGLRNLDKWGGGWGAAKTGACYQPVERRPEEKLVIEGMNGMRLEASSTTAAASK